MAALLHEVEKNTMARNPSNSAETPKPVPTRPSTSLTLLQRLRDNEPEAWRTMVQLYKPLIFHWCARGGVRGADAEDVVQEVFREAVPSLGRFRREREGDSFRAWLRGITRNMVLQHFRRANRQPQARGGTDAFVQLQEVAEGETPASDEEDPPSELEALRRRALELVRGQVEERTWQAFWLTAMEERSSMEVAASLGVSATAVRTAKSRVLRRLKDQFSELIQ
jgi:RNA polymerase sigma-70 factor (ECF subfamily)